MGWSAKGRGREGTPPEGGWRDSKPGLHAPPNTQQDAAPPSTSTMPPLQLLSGFYLAAGNGGGESNI